MYTGFSIPGALSRDSIKNLCKQTARIHGLPFLHTKIEEGERDPWGWKKGFSYNNYEFYRTHELPTKDESLINVILVNDATSFGAAKDAGLAILRSAIFKSYAVISLSMQCNDEGREIKDDYSRIRTLVLKQFEQFATLCPWIRHYVRFVTTLDELQSTVEAIAENSPILPQVAKKRFRLW